MTKTSFDHVLSLSMNQAFFLLIFIWIYLSIEDDLSSPKKDHLVELLEVEILYLNECLQIKDSMNVEDSLNTIIELEHFYTLIKMNEDGNWFPSAMVDQAWHHHILNTQMYNQFSLKHFQMDILHHLPFWSGNTQKPLDKDQEEYFFLSQYNTMISIFGVEYVNRTIWDIDQEQFDHLLSKETKYHQEF